MDFYRVIESEIIDPDNPDTQRVTLQGTDFRFTGSSSSPNSLPPDPDPMNMNPENTDTYAILIPGVLAVYERTIRPEPTSDYSFE